MDIYIYMSTLLFSGIVDPMSTTGTLAWTVWFMLTKVSQVSQKTPRTYNCKCCLMSHTS